MNRRTFLTSLAGLAVLPKLVRGEPKIVVPQPKAPYSPAGINYDALLWAIAQVETGGDDTKIGPCGERSQYQITWSVWKQHTPLTTHEEFRVRCYGSQAGWCATKHFLWAWDNMRFDKQSVTGLAYAWRYGLLRWQQRGILWLPLDDSDMDYANRVTRFYLWKCQDLKYQT